MIAPLRNPSTQAKTPPVGPRHIGQLLPQVLARYGIVMSVAELAAFQPSTPEKTAMLQKTMAPSQPWKWSSRRFRHRSSEPAAWGHRKMVQLPLFQSTHRAAIDDLAVH